MLKPRRKLASKLDCDVGTYRLRRIDGVYGKSTVVPAHPSSAGTRL